MIFSYKSVKIILEVSLLTARDIFSLVGQIILEVGLLTARDIFLLAGPNNFRSGSTYY